MIRRFLRRSTTILLIAVLILSLIRARTGFRLPRAGGWAASRTLPLRPSGVRVTVDAQTVWVDDGDTLKISWPNAPRETVRILGIDAPEIRHRDDPSSEDQPFGQESLSFARRSILGARRLELMRASFSDRFGRTLGYIFVDGVNYSVLAIENHLAESTIDRFGDSGFPREAGEVREAATRVGPPPFESPVRFRDRRDVTPGSLSPAPASSGGTPAQESAPRPPRFEIKP